MSGVEGLGQRALAGRQGPGVADKTAAFDHLGLQVTPENVLGIYAVIQEEVTRLTVSLNLYRSRSPLGMPKLGDDLVSEPAARGFTEATGQLLAKCLADVNELAKVAQVLADVARAYGKTEEQIASAFNPERFRYQPSPVPSSSAPSDPSGGGGR